jgi:hypothetical protein
MAQQLDLSAILCLQLGSRSKPSNPQILHTTTSQLVNCPQRQLPFDHQLFINAQVLPQVSCTDYQRRAFCLGEIQKKKMMNDQRWIWEESFQKKMEEEEEED